MDKAKATTPEEFAAQFPITARPFAVWYNAEPEAVNNRPWALNDDSGEASQEFDDMATALKRAAEMGKEWADEARHQAQELAKVAGADAMPKVNLTDADFDDIHFRLSDIGYSLLSIRELALSAADGEPHQIQHYLTAIMEMARADVKGLDACLRKLGSGVVCMGNFESEFDRS